MVRPHPVGAEAERAFRRCPARARAVIMLSSLTEAYPRQLAQAIHVDASRLRAIMEGSPPHYSVPRSPVALGLATILPTSHGQKYVITEKGRRKARMLTARAQRRRGGQQLRAQVSEPAPTPAPAPVASFTWSLRPHPP